MIILEFMVNFVEVDYRYEEGEGDSDVCIEGVGLIAQPVTITVSSLNNGTATGTITHRYIDSVVYANALYV